ncbi:MAG: threonylcarbamoyl-AMP synthase [Lachnospiraceae bacterium]|nr:threonylcarbamoyl-AMP synthase [Lachnospiraceae bacterium]
MDTIVKKIDADDIRPEDFDEAVRILKNGGLVAFPTETVYGLGGDARNPEASAKIYAAKGRPSDNPLIVHIADIEDLGGICGCTGNNRQTGIKDTADTDGQSTTRDIMDKAYALARRFWPGPLTMILPKGSMIPPQTTGGLDTVAVRFPSHPIAQALIKAAGLPIAAPSANLSGRPSTTKAEHVIEDLSGRVDMIIDGGSSDIGLESTIVDLTAEPPLVLRPGYISIDELKEILPDIEYDKAVVSRTANPDIRPKAPGMKYRHYAPKGELTVFEGSADAVIDAVNRALAEKKAEGHSVGVLASEEFAGRYECANIKVLGSRHREDEIAAHLFDALRSFDADGTEFIFGECFIDTGIGAAIMNRLIKAAGYRIVKV